jgi:hypothetical protein
MHDLNVTRVIMYTEWFLNYYIDYNLMLYVMTKGLKLQHVH